MIVQHNNDFLLAGSNVIAVEPEIKFNAIWRADVVEKDANNRVSAFYDITGNGNHTYQTTQSFKPLWNPQHNLFNNRPSISFNGTSEYLDGGGSILNAGLQNIYVFAVGLTQKATGAFISKTLAGGGARDRWSLYYETVGAGIQMNGQLTSVADTGYTGRLFVGYRANNQTFLRLNGAQVAMQNFNFVNKETNYNLLIGAYNNGTGGVPPFAGYYLQGHICELRVLITTRVLTQLQLISIENELKDYYGLSF